jgi:hypothetical protein
VFLIHAVCEGLCNFGVVCLNAPYVAEGCGIGHGVIDIEQKQAVDLRRVLLTAHPLGDERLLRARAALFLQLLHVVTHRIDQVIGELPIALPGVAQQIEMGLVRLEITQVVDGIEVH